MREGRILQVDEQILDACRPVIGEGALDAGARGPADLAGALPIRGGVNDDVTEGAAAGQVEQDAIGSVADAGANRGEAFRALARRMAGVGGGSNS